MSARHYAVLFFVFAIFFSSSFHIAHASGKLAVDLTSGANTGGTSLTSGTNTGPNSGTVTLRNPVGDGVDLNKFLAGILKLVVEIGTVVIVLMMVYIGYLFVMARGEANEITKARRALLWTIVGALILLGAQAISLGIQATVNAISNG